jgi:hypothetical protein
MRRWTLAVTLTLLACGSPKPATNAQNDVDASAEPVKDETPPTPPAAEPDAGAVATPEPTPPPPPAQPPDECTPLAVDFEKRARPKLKDCYREGKKKDPDLKGTVRIAIDIDMLGKIKSTKITEKTLPEPVAQCMLKVVKATPFPEVSKCPGKSLTIPMTFPTPH